MRKQYHSRQTPKGLFVWDVHKLIEQAKGLEAIQKPLSEINELDELYWFNENKIRPTPRKISIHAMLIEKADLSHPIILDADGRVMDGMHRCCKALINGDTEILATQFSETPEPHFIDVKVKDLPHDSPVTL